MVNYPGANRSQWFGGRYPGSPMRPNVALLHTTEGTSWPSYAGGATTPHLTLMPNHARRRLDVRQHLPLERSARALQNDAGGVETNTANVVQIELVGTSRTDAGGPGMCWPQAPDWALEELGEVLATLHTLFPAIPLHSSVKWVAYPASYGERASQRLSGQEWRTFRGVCGHQHVPENDHGDPGALPIGKVIAAALNLNPPKEHPGMNHVEAGRRHARTAQLELLAAIGEFRKAKGRRYVQIAAGVWAVAEATIRRGIRIAPLK